MKYLITAALLDGTVGPDQLRTERILSTDSQAMVARVEVRPGAQLSARFPKELAARITVTTKAGRKLVKEHLGYEGGIDSPMSWERVVEKFQWLSEASADEALGARSLKRSSTSIRGRYRFLWVCWLKFSRQPSNREFAPAFSSSPTMGRTQARAVC